MKTASVASRILLGVADLSLLSNRFVPLVLTVLAAVIANILVFHITMMPAGLQIAFVVTALWTIVAFPFRSAFAPLLVQNSQPEFDAAHAPAHARASSEDLASC